MITSSLVGSLLLVGSVVSSVLPQAQIDLAMPVHVDTIVSQSLGKRIIYIATPQEYAGSQARYPVLIALDANDTPEFRLWLAQTHFLAENAPGAPQMIIVGIVNGQYRLHDMLPPATGSSVKSFPRAGGAEAFAQFITTEVLPLVRTKYRTLPATFLAGHSAGGLFALDVAAKRPEAFRWHRCAEPCALVQ